MRHVLTLELNDDDFRIIMEEIERSRATTWATKDGTIPGPHDSNTEGYLIASAIHELTEYRKSPANPLILSAEQMEELCQKVIRDSKYGQN